MTQSALAAVHGGQCEADPQNALEPGGQPLGGASVVGQEMAKGSTAPVAGTAGPNYQTSVGPDMAEAEGITGRATRWRAPSVMSRAWTTGGAAPRINGEIAGRLDRRHGPPPEGV